MDEENFKKLITYVEEPLTKKDTLMRQAIPVSEKLAATLKFLATGESFTSLNYQSKLSTTFLYKNIIEICNIIYHTMKDDYLKFPTSKQEWKCIAERFRNRWQFPLCLAALDGKHIAFRPSRKDGSFYYNYKGFHSIVLLALVDADCKILYCDVGCNGRISNGGVLRRSSVKTVLDNAEQFFPAQEIIGDNRKLPYVIVGDDAFPLMKNLMKPFPYNSEEVSKQIFNKRLSTARYVVEHAFGMLSNRFQILQKH